MEKPNYSIKNLEAFLLQKKAGHTDPLMEQQIEEDDLLQAILIGLEKTMTQHNTTSTTAILKEKKEQNWRRLSAELASVNNTSTSLPQRLFTAAKQYFSLPNYVPQYQRIHLLLSFNCSCVLAFLVLAWWLKDVEGATALVAHLVELVGYKA
jgi:hypothetical protein